MSNASPDVEQMREQLTALRRRVAELERGGDGSGLERDWQEIAMARGPDLERAVNTGHLESSAAGAAIDAPIDALFILDKDLKFRGERHAPGFPFLMPPSDFLGRKWDEVWPADVAALVANAVERLTNETLIEGVPYTLIAEGERRDCQMAVMRGFDGGYLVGIRNVTSAKAAEIALQTASQRFRLFAENSTDMISRHDSGGAYVYVSPACRPLMGYEPEELLGKSAYDLIHPDDIPHVIKSHSKVLLQNAPNVVAFRLMRKDGSSVWVETISKTLREPGSNRVIEIQCSTRDITEQKTIENELRASREQWRTLVANSSAYITLLDVKGEILSVNRMPPGYREQDLIGKNLLDVASPDTRPVLEAGLRRVVATNATQSFEARGRPRPDGVAWYETRMSPVSDAGGAVVSVIMEAREITARKLAEERLRQSESFLHAIIENIPLSVFLKDARDRFKVVMWNKASEQMFGRTKHEVLGKSAADDWPPEQAAAYETVDRQVIAERRAIEIPEEETESKTLGRRTLHTHKVPLFDLTGEPTHVLCLCEDITEQKRALEQAEQLQQELRHAHQMESLGTLAAGVAHDLRNLLMAMAGYTELSARALSADHPARQSLKDLEEVSAQARNVTDALLSFGEKRQTPRSRFNLRQAVAGAMVVIRRLTPRSVVIEEDLSQTDDLWIDGHLSAIHRVLINLAVNARDAMPGGGKLTIGLRVSPPGSAGSSAAGGDRAWAELSVQDNGKGMTAETRRRMFEPFFSNRLAGAGAGMGLGMAIVAEAVREHGGRIEVQSQPQQGTQVIVRLPTCDAPAPGEVARDSRTSVPTAGSMILLAEGEMFIRRIIASRLRLAGHAVIEATECQAASAILQSQSQRIGLIIFSDQLPGSAGHDCMGLIRQTLPNVPVIMLTAAPAASPKSSGLAAAPLVVTPPVRGASPPIVVARPFQVADLLRVVEDCLQPIDDSNQRGTGS